MKPESLPEFDQRPPVGRRYRKPRSYISWVGVVLGLAIGIGGGLLYTWVLSPVVEFNTQPWQLNEEDRGHYIVAIMLDYAYNADLRLATQRLAELRLPRDFIQEVADVACRLATSGYADSSSGLRALQAMISFYRLQGRAGCADDLIVMPAAQATQIVVIEPPTPTLAPVASKTPTPEGAARTTPTPTIFIVPTNVPRNDFEIANIPTFCSVQTPGVIEVQVVDFNGQGIPGQIVRVRWDGGESVFATGLKPERGPGFADFRMEPGLSYLVDMPGLSDPSQPLTATSCALEDGARAVISYRVVFRPAG